MAYTKSKTESNKLLLNLSTKNSAKFLTIQLA